MVLVEPCQSKADVLVVLFIRFRENENIIQQDHYDLIQGIPKTLLMKCWNVVGALKSPKGIRRYSQCPYQVQNAILHSFLPLDTEI